MTAAHDVFAETNPAFCAAALAAFTKAYLTGMPEGPEMPVAYLALPIALSGELAATFEGTNKNTGLREWLQRSPQVHLGLADRVNATLDSVTDALRFGCFSGLLSMRSGARLQLGRKTLKASAISALGEEAAQALKRAERLGHWFSTAGTTRTIFDIAELTV